jgi:predicted Zn-dependent protease
LCGCAGAVHRLPPIGNEGLGLAQTEVQSAGGAPPRRIITDQQATELLNRALQRIRPAAGEICREMNVGVCVWQFRASAERTLNAASGPDGLIIINRGIAEYAANEEEVELVIAHEMGHQMANHIVTGQRNARVGAAVGAVLMGALGAVASRGSYNSGTITRSSAQAGANVGGAIGRISFSKEQEREADYLAALILYRAGVDLDKARGFLVTMARASGRKETGMLDTHPAGPERIAGWDQAVAEIRASNGRLPPRA